MTKVIENGQQYSHHKHIMKGDKNPNSNQHAIRLEKQCIVNISECEKERLQKVSKTASQLGPMKQIKSKVFSSTLFLLSRAFYCKFQHLEK